MSDTSRSPRAPVYQRPLCGAGPCPRPHAPHDGSVGVGAASVLLCVDFSPNKTCFVVTPVLSKGFFPTLGHKDRFLYYLLKLL